MRALRDLRLFKKKKNYSLFKYGKARKARKARQPWVPSTVSPGRQRPGVGALYRVPAANDDGATTGAHDKYRWEHSSLDVHSRKVGSAPLKLSENGRAETGKPRHGNRNEFVDVVWRPSMLELRVEHLWVERQFSRRPRSTLLVQH